LWFEIPGLKLSARIKKISFLNPTIVTVRNYFINLVPIVIGKIIIKKIQT